MGILWACEIKTVTQLTMVKVTREYLICIIIDSGVIKLRMEMWNVSKRQQPDRRAENSRRPPMGLQYSEKILNPEVCFSWPLNNNVYYSTHREDVMSYSLHCKNLVSHQEIPATLSKSWEETWTNSSLKLLNCLLPWCGFSQQHDFYCYDYL